MRYVVGYVPNQHGLDAVRLAATLATRRAGATLDIVVVLPVETATLDMYSPDHAYYTQLEKQAREWLSEAMAAVPEGISANGRVVQGETITEGLIEAATDPGLGSQARLIVIGTAQRGLRGRFTIGSIASSLLHCSPVPVALAPDGYEYHPGLSRITCATGTRPGAEALLNVAISGTAHRGVPLRLMSLVALGDASDDGEGRIAAAERHAAGLAQKAKAALPEGSDVTAVVGRGHTLEDCVHALDFSADEIVLVGSSRLAGPRRLFIGASANKMLRALPVPMIVVPHEYELPQDGDD